MKHVLFSIVTTFILGISTTHASIINLDVDSDSININAQIDYLLSSSENLDIVAIHNFFNDRFTSNHRQLVVADLSEEDLWLRVHINNPSKNELDRILMFDTQSAVLLKQFIKVNNNLFTILETGRNIPFTERPLSSSTLAFQIQIPPGQSQHYFKVSADQSILMDLRLLKEPHFYQMKFKQDTLYGALLMFLILIASSAIFQSFRKRRLIYLSIAAFALTKLVSIIGSFGFYSPWIDISFIDVLIHNSMNMLSNGAFILLVTHLMQSLSEKINQVLWYIATLSVFVALYSFSAETTQLTMYFTGFTLIIHSALAGIIIMGHGKYTQLTYIAAYLMVLQACLTTLTLIGKIDLLYPITVLQPLSFVVITYLLFFDQYFKTDSYSSASLVDSSDIEFTQQVPDFLKAFCNDLSIPISSIFEFTEALNDTNLSIKQREMLNTINDSTIELLRNSEKMYAFHRILVSADVSMNSVQLHSLIHKQISSFTLQASNKEVELICDIQHQVPKKVLIDAQGVKFILSALLRHSLLNTPSGEIICKVTPDEDNKIRIRVTDTGQGIRSEELRKAFLFTHSSSELTHKTLSICSMLAKQMGGEMGASSELGKGSTYWLTIPIITEIENNKFLSDAKKLLRTTKILIIDDNNTSRNVIQQYAADVGIQVDSCRNAHEALVLMQTKNHLDQAFDFLFIDQNMPTINGIQLANRLKNNPRLSNYINVVLLTDQDTSESDSLLNDNGIDYILNKPVSSDEMYQLLLKSLPQFRDDIIIEN